MKQYDRIYCKVKIQLIYHILNNITKNIYFIEYPINIKLITVYHHI